MALDAMFVSGLTAELNAELTGARVDKIHQPERDEIVLALRGTGFSGRLLLSANPNYPRVHKIKNSRENPSSAPMFCMLLRKHLTNGRICSVTQPGLERILDICFEVNDEMGVQSKKTLTVEMLGRHSNIILRDSEDRIIDCLKRVDLEMSEKRQILPGLFYTLPPQQDKRNPLTIGRDELLYLLCEASGDISADKWLLNTFFGISPLICREIVYRATRDVSTQIAALTDGMRERIAAEAETVFADVKNGNINPCLLLEGDRPSAFSFMPILQYEGTLKSEKRISLSELLDDFYRIRDGQDRMRRRSQSISKTVNSAIERIRRKLEIQKEELRTSMNREELRIQADLITANLYRCEKGMNKLTAQNYFLPDCPEIEISLDLRLTPQQNAAKLYKTYHRLKNAEYYLNEQISQGEQELIYLESVTESISKAECEQDLSEIREELTESGYLTASKGTKKNTKRKLNPYEFRSSEGFRIYAGRNNRQNDILTLKTAFKSDLWLHTQKIPGSHVIIECEGNMPTDQTITEAAIIGAYFSRARESQKVPVDYTQVKFIKKPPGAKPGMVIYNSYKTAYVTPDQKLVEKLRIK